MAIIAKCLQDRATPEWLLTPSQPRSPHTELIATHAALHGLRLYVGPMYDEVGAVIGSAADGDPMRQSAYRLVTRYHEHIDWSIRGGRGVRHAFTWLISTGVQSMAFKALYTGSFLDVCDELYENLTLDNLDALIHLIGEQHG